MSTSNNKAFEKYEAEDRATENKLRGAIAKALINYVVFKHPTQAELELELSAYVRSLKFEMPEYFEVAK